MVHCSASRFLHSLVGYRGISASHISAYCIRSPLNQFGAHQSRRQPEATSRPPAPLVVRPHSRAFGSPQLQLTVRLNPTDRPYPPSRLPRCVDSPVVRGNSAKNPYEDCTSPNPSNPGTVQVPDWAEMGAPMLRNFRIISPD